MESGEEDFLGVSFFLVEFGLSLLLLASLILGTFSFILLLLSLSHLAMEPTYSLLKYLKEALLF